MKLKHAKMLKSEIKLLPVSPTDLHVLINPIQKTAYALPVRYLHNEYAGISVLKMWYIRQVLSAFIGVMVKD